MKKKIEEIEVPSPAGICDECAENPRRAARCSSVVAIYCPHNQCGAVIRLDEIPRQWTLVTPIPQIAFAAMARHAVEGNQTKEKVFN